MLRKTAFDLLKQEIKEKAHIHTSWGYFDRFLGKGIKTKTITEITGLPGTGKSQLCYIMSVEVTLQEPDLEVLFIGTGSDFSKKRLVEIAHNAALKRNTESRERNIKRPDVVPAQMLKRIKYVACECSADLNILSNSFMLNPYLSTKIRLVVVDSFSYIFRGEAKKRCPGRIRLLYDVLRNLQVYANLVNCAIIITNEMTTRISRNFRSKYKSYNKRQSFVVPALGDTFYHRVNTRIVLKKVRNRTLIHIRKNYFHGNPRFFLRINAKRI